MMKDMTIKIASINHPPYVVVNETGNNTWELSGGIDADVIDILRQKFNFKYKVVVPTVATWGELVNGRWTGVVGMAHRNEVDLGICNMMMTEQRYNAVLFSVPYNSDGWLMVSLAPRYVENTYAVLQPFTKEVWSALLMSVLISTCLLFALQRIRSRLKWTPNLTWSNTLWNVFAVLCEEGVKLNKIQGSGLLYFIVWMFSTMIFQVLYSGNLVGFLTFPTMTPSIKTMEQLATAIHTRDIKLSYKKFSLARKHLINHIKYGELFTECINKERKSEVSTYAGAFHQVLRGDFVFFANEFGCIYNSYVVDFTRLQMSSVFERNYITVAFSPKFQYSKEFDKILRRLSERGLIYKWRTDILFRQLIKSIYEDENEDIDESKEESKITALKITHLSSAFLFLAIGNTVGFIALVTEIIFNKFYSVKKKKQMWRHR